MTKIDFPKLFFGQCGLIGTVRTHELYRVLERALLQLLPKTPRTINIVSREFLNLLHT